MAFFDFSLEELHQYTPEIREEQDFDVFWDRTIRDARHFPMNPEFVPVNHPFHHLDIFDVDFPGFGGQRVRGWYVRPKNADGLLPCLLEFIGYGGGRSLPHEWTMMAGTGMAHFIMDTRGQGSGWSPGSTPDRDSEATGGQIPGFMTRGILSPEEYYYRRVFTDAVRAYDCLLSRPEIDPARIAIGGGSQGGGITLAASGLLPDVQIAFPDVPFLCHFHRAVRVTDSMPYGEIKQYLATHRTQSEVVHKTLSYFDGVNFAKRARAKAFFSTALMDDICPPSTVFAAYNHYAGEKSIKVWEFNGHEGGGVYQKARQLSTLVELWGLGTR